MSTKIVVIKFKELLKKVALVILGIVILGILVYAFVPKNNKSQALYEPGTYYSEIILHNNPVRVDVTVNEKEILDIQMTELAESQAVFYPLMQTTAKEIAEEIIETQSLEITASSDKEMTTKIIIDAVQAALDKASSNKTEDNNKKESVTTTQEPSTEATSKALED